MRARNGRARGWHDQGTACRARTSLPGRPDGGRNWPLKGHHAGDGLGSACDFGTSSGRRPSRKGGFYRGRRSPPVTTPGTVVSRDGGCLQAHPPWRPAGAWEAGRRPRQSGSPRAALRPSSRRGAAGDHVPTHKAQELGRRDPMLWSVTTESQPLPGMAGCRAESEASKQALARAQDAQSAAAGRAESTRGISPRDHPSLRDGRRPGPGSASTVARSPYCSSMTSAGSQHLRSISPVPAKAEQSTRNCSRSVAAAGQPWSSNRFELAGSCPAVMAPAAVHAAGARQAPRQSATSSAWAVTQSQDAKPNSWGEPNLNSVPVFQAAADWRSRGMRQWGGAAKQAKVEFRGSAANQEYVSDPQSYPSSLAASHLQPAKGANRLTRAVCAVNQWYAARLHDHHVASSARTGRGSSGRWRQLPAPVHWPPGYAQPSLRRANESRSAFVEAQAFWRHFQG